MSTLSDSPTRTIVIYRTIALKCDVCHIQTEEIENPRMCPLCFRPLTEVTKKIVVTQDV